MPASEGVIGIEDLALQRGYGVFDFGRTYNGKLFHFEENIKRFVRSASALHLVPPVSEDEIFDIAQRLVDGSDLKTPCVRLLLTGGYSPDLEDPNFIVIAEELPTYPDDLYADGASIITLEYQRELPQIKSINYLNAIRIEPLKKQKNVFDVLYHSEGRITECPRNNFFAFIGNTLVTPAEDVLFGVTRKIVLALAKPHFEIEERQLMVEELAGIDEAFVTSTSKMVLPVTEIDGAKVGGGKVGPGTKKLMRLFDDYVSGY